MILEACILSGCDYLDSLDGIGVKTAVKLLKKHRNVESVLRTLRIESGMPIDNEYETRYMYGNNSVCECKFYLLIYSLFI